MQLQTSIHWKSALSFCETLSFGNYSDWRLPSVQELLSIADYQKFYPASQLPIPTQWLLWSSTTIHLSKDRAFVLYTTEGSITWRDKSDNSNAAICVRDDI
jgi:hypothetical protein